MHQLLSLEAFLARYGDDPRYELVEGELIDMEPMTNSIALDSLSSPAFCPDCISS